jgi:hypothetical protein
VCRELPIRLATWNCCRGAYDIKISLLAGLAPDVAVLQECPLPGRTSDTVVWFGTNPRQGVSILSRPPFQLIPEPIRAGSESMFAARVHGPICFTLIAVWAQPEPSYSEALRRGVQVYGDLLVNGPAVLLGDFNSSAAWDAQRGRRDHLDFEAQLRQEYGLVSAYHAATGETLGSESQPTHYWRWREQSPFHLDYCYLPQAWLRGLASVTVGTYREWADVSDHRPIIIDVDPAKAAAEADLK